MACIELPKDAEGREIPLDVEMLYDEYGEKFLTDRATYMRKSGSWWFSGHFDLQSVQHRYMASRLHLTQPDSWKRLKEDLRRTMGASDAVCAYFGGDNRDCAACGARGDGDPMDANGARNLWNRGPIKIRAEVA